MNSHRKDIREAFTLIEVMIVILIGGLLMAGAFAGFRYFQQAKVSETDRRLANVDTLLEQYNIRLGEYPENLNELVDGPQKPNLAKKWAESMAQANDLKDAWGQPFEYERTTKGYDLYSRGSKGNSQIRSPRSRED